MENSIQKLHDLFEKPVWTDLEKKWLLDYLDNNNSPELKALMLKRFKTDSSGSEKLPAALSKKMLDSIHQTIGVKQETRKRPVLQLFSRKLAAAALLGIILTTGYLLFRHKENTERIAKTLPESTQSIITDIPPGGNRAMLTLSDGSTITLEDAGNGVLARQGKTNIQKLDSIVSYNGAVSISPEILYNTISTAKGGTYQIILPDGSHVWLNASSSIRFPTAFPGNDRTVAITGEAYFEVAKNPSQPFIVKVNEAQVQVLGTHFNIMAYGDASTMNTTLLEGSVKFSSGSSNNILTPGQQIQLHKNGSIRLENSVDVDEVIAWKNGFFQFRDADIETVLQQLSRWYDIDVVYAKSPGNERFFAEIPRNTNLSDALKALELTGKIHIKIDGKKVTVEP